MIIFEINGEIDFRTDGQALPGGAIPLAFVTRGHLPGQHDSQRYKITLLDYAANDATVDKIRDSLHEWGVSVQNLSTTAESPQFGESTKDADCRRWLGNWGIGTEY